eukprot:TRINITY_DN33659_c0_g1_i1.p3 TRINITY_DN33659_c0_g1~~TRINITY_DN33659_c0_g1_i1.p3  ORF type:complete len:170 (-),score=44.50 TRINITY_DN33659_c0_g1_i1:266-775(-)
MWRDVFLWQCLLVVKSAEGLRLGETEDFSTDVSRHFRDDYSVNQSELDEVTKKACGEAVPGSEQRGQLDHHNDKKVCKCPPKMSLAAYDKKKKDVTKPTSSCHGRFFDPSQASKHDCRCYEPEGGDKCIQGDCCDPGVHGSLQTEDCRKDCLLKAHCTWDEDDGCMHAR